MSKPTSWHLKYPNPRLKLHRGVWTVFISIPRSIRHLFGKKGVTTEIRRVAGSNEPEAENLRKISYDIYKLMDLVQQEGPKKKIYQKHFGSQVPTVLKHRCKKVLILVPKI